eukprot:CAMPEP_0201132644 /NCGR_PEP_ID=MMETSP0850-20130426/46420_1 /ASSEMBLY_ACC=CAM_ASM_000622 /TAXON_ID=183588 /ORGANISM="Pseudo-nitzschia fraudulenta, Strain WWA7" /LENGTH=257 /DNA_ID=CAMNT_0047403033 /DNA_START=312 /DNA_END=1085 /DNA_ORIENTATION=+
MDDSLGDGESSTVPRYEQKRGRRFMDRWLCRSAGNATRSGKSRSSKRKAKKAAANNIQSKLSYSSSTSSSHPEDDDNARDDRVEVFRATRNENSERTGAPDGREPGIGFMSTPPSAAQAAFEGPPRFDWIDIEYNAATKVQKIFRRHLVLRELEEVGLTTSYIRNRKRQRKVFYSAQDDTAPDTGFGCCSMGLAFDSGDDDTIAVKEFQRRQYEEKKKARQEREEFLSQSYLEQKGINSKLQELEQTKFRNEMLLGL